MKIFTSFRNFLQQREIVHHSDDIPTRHDNSHHNSQNNNIKNPVNLEPGLEFLDGMSTGTARFIIDREISPEILEKYDIKDLASRSAKSSS
ncbi:hypothetical protein D1BOALGB6SA_4249 [Olavius sp. associated proteobacterium Delta 1]|nr:hypothetical protein D1BOALGB6SA_4249 [Olavius sp. associated proteobacterium Delta 1]